MSWFVDLGVILAAALIGNRAGRLVVSGRLKFRWVLLAAATGDVLQRALWQAEILRQAEDQVLVAALAFLGVALGVVLKERVPDAPSGARIEAPARVP
jgi:hypothetical protein